MTVMPSSLTQGIMDELNEMVKSGRLDPLTLMDIAKVIGTNVQSWTDAKVAKIDEMVAEWEATMGDSDKTYYSLGLRRAVDVIREQNAYSQLPILETPETP